MQSDQDSSRVLLYRKCFHSDHLKEIMEYLGVTSEEVEIRKISDAGPK